MPHCGVIPAQKSTSVIKQYLVFILILSTTSALSTPNVTQELNNESSVYCSPLLKLHGYGNRYISESGRVNRDLNLLKIREREENTPCMIIGGDTVFLVRSTRLPGRPYFLLKEMSPQLQNLRLNIVNNFSPWIFTSVNYQINTEAILDAFVTIGDLERSPFFVTIGDRKSVV